MNEKLNLEERVKDAMEFIRPAMQRDGGDVELVEVTEDGIVRVRLKGACGGCPMAAVTLKMGIEKTLKSKIPEIKLVEAVS